MSVMLCSGATFVRKNSYLVATIVSFDTAKIVKSNIFELDYLTRGLLLKLVLLILQLVLLVFLLVDLNW